MRNTNRIGRKTHIVECRATGGTNLGGNLAFPGTLSEAQYPDVIVIAMSPSPRHITKPVCQITYSLREAGLETSVLVLSSGTGTSCDVAPSNTLGASIMSISEQEKIQIRRHRVAIIHVGNVPSHFIPKIKQILEDIDILAIVISQAPFDLDDLSLVGIRTMENELAETKGCVFDVVNGIVRGQRCTSIKISEIITKTQHAIRYTRQQKS